MPVSPSSSSTLTNRASPTVLKQIRSATKALKFWLSVRDGTAGGMAADMAVGWGERQARLSLARWRGMVHARSFEKLLMALVRQFSAGRTYVYAADVGGEPLLTAFVQWRRRPRPHRRLRVRSDHLECRPTAELACSEQGVSHGTASEAREGKGGPTRSRFCSAFSPDPCIHSGAPLLIALFLGGARCLF